MKSYPFYRALIKQGASSHMLNIKIALLFSSVCPNPSGLTFCPTTPLPPYPEARVSRRYGFPESEVCTIMWLARGVFQSLHYCSVHLCPHKEHIHLGDIDFRFPYIGEGRPRDYSAMVDSAILSAEDKLLFIRYNWGQTS